MAWHALTRIFWRQAEMKKAGNAVSNNLCPHFALSRADLFNIVKYALLRAEDRR